MSGGTIVMAPPRSSCPDRQIFKGFTLLAQLSRLSRWLATGGRQCPQASRQCGRAAIRAGPLFAIGQLASLVPQLS